MTIWRKRIACCIPNATNTHSEYAILLFHGNNGFEKAPECCFTYMACFVMVMKLVSKHKHIKLRLFQSTILIKIFVCDKGMEKMCTVDKPFNKYLGDELKDLTIDWETFDYVRYCWVLREIARVLKWKTAIPRLVPEKDTLPNAMRTPFQQLALLSSKLCPKMLHLKNIHMYLPFWIRNYYPVPKMDPWGLPYT
jgi:hypothetical protein